MSDEIAFDIPVYVQGYDGWGPSSQEAPENAHPLSSSGKLDRLGAFGNYLSGTAQSFQGRSRNKSSLQTSGHDMEDSFQLVEGKFQSRSSKNKPFFLKQNVPRHQRGGFRGQQQPNRRYNQYHHNSFINRKHSVVIKHNWIEMDRFDIKLLKKLEKEVDPGTVLHECGKLTAYDKALDSLSSRNMVQLEALTEEMNEMLPSQDAILMDFAERGEGQVFASDTLISYLLSAARSVFSWDLLLKRVGDNLLIEKRETSRGGLVSIPDPLIEELGEEEVKKLLEEALNVDKKLRKHVSRIKEGNPVSWKSDSAFEGEAGGFLYKKYEVGYIDFIIRSRVDCIEPKKGKEEDRKPAFMNVHSLFETKPNQTDWKNKLETQSGAILASEFRNNSFMIARWVSAAILSGSGVLFGFTSRKSGGDPKDHVLLGTKKYTAEELETHINLSFKNGWGILSHICSRVLEYSVGNYVIVKDPISSHLTVYQVADDEKFEES